MIWTWYQSGWTGREYTVCLSVIVEWDYCLDDYYRIILCAVLNNDHARLMAQIEAKLHKLHAHTRGDVDVSAPIQHTRSCVEEERVAAPLAVPAKSTLPFAIVDEVSRDGPAMHAGVAVGDKVLQCAHITGQTPNSLATMGSLVSESENRVLDLVVLRGDDVLRLKLHPKKWSGRGLLGCHLSPMRE